MMCFNIFAAVNSAEIKNKNSRHDVSQKSLKKAFGKIKPKILVTISFPTECLKLSILH